MSQKLKTLKPLVRTLQPRIRSITDHAVRESAAPWREWYCTPEWKKLRLVTFIADGYVCRMCSRLCTEDYPPACDHIVPHRGDKVLFFDPNNLQTLCKPCHDGPKQRHEKRHQYI